MDALWIKITNTYSKWPQLACTQSLSLCGHSSIELLSTSTWKSAAAFRRDCFKRSILGYLFLQAISWSLDHDLYPKGFRSGLAEGQSEVSLEHLFPATAGLSMPCVLGLNPAGSSSSVHGRGCCKKRHPNIEISKRSLRKAAADFPVDMLLNSIDEWSQYLKDCVHANGDQFE